MSARLHPGNHLLLDRQEPDRRYGRFQGDLRERDMVELDRGGK
jgi:hypothetical protein